MSALTKDRKTDWRAAVDFSDPAAAAALIYVGAIVCLNATGYAVPGSADNTLKVRGVARERIDNTNGADGDLDVPTQKGLHKFANDGTITRADLEANAYIVDDQTVADNDNGGARPLCGVIKQVDSDGVWVFIA